MGLDLRGLSTLGIVSSKLYMKDDFSEFLFAFLLSLSFSNGLYCNRKEFAPLGSKVFPFSAKQFRQLPPLKVYSFKLYIQASLSRYLGIKGERNTNIKYVSQ